MFSNQINDIIDLRRNIPRVKLSNPVKKVNPPLKLIDQNQKSDSTKKALKNYCRTCAGMKIALIDIFSEKGIQMKLYQQIRHLKNIKKSDSLSTQVCINCIRDLNMSYTFFMQIKEAENKLKSIQAKLLEAETANSKKQEEVSTIDPLFISHDPENLNNGPRISAVYSAQDSQIWEPDPLSNVKVEPQTQEENKFQSDDDSIEEFDPEDPPYNPDSEEKENTKKKQVTAPSFVQSPKKLEVKSIINKEAEKREIESESLKRKLSEKRNEAVDRLSKLKAIGPKDAKIRRLNENEALNIKKEENGLKYVTVRSTKPNELLLVKVKKMEKTEKCKAVGKKEVSKEKEKDPLTDRFFEIKGQIIEEEIEEYKKKREKILRASAQNDATEVYRGEAKIKNGVFYVKEKENKLQSDDDSLEEFDPEDPPYNPDTEEEKNMEEELVTAPSFFRSPKKLEATSFMNKKSKKRETESESLKRKLSEERNKDVDGLAKLKMTGLEDVKIKRLSVAEALNTKEDESGVMCIAVRGSKPNELFLMKVKKMEKAKKSKIVVKKEVSIEKEKEQVEEYYNKKAVQIKPVLTKEISKAVSEIDENRRECPVCEKMILFPNFSRHLNKHKPYTIKCPYCDKMFKYPCRLKQHIGIHKDP